MKYTKNYDVTAPLDKKPMKDDLPSRIPRRYSACGIVGSRGSGKSNLVRWLVENFYRKSYKTIFILSVNAYIDPIWDSLKKYKNIIFFDQCSPEFLKEFSKIQKERVELYGRKAECLLILDDFSVEKNLQKSIEKICSRGRHILIQFIFVSQYYRHMSTGSRCNLDNLILYKLSDNEYEKVSMDVPQVPKDEFIKICNICTEEPRSFLHINFKSNDKILSEKF